ncbi:hypothetical protein HJC23_008414 [Cyclotella cryptica]|uniref:Uncharacterized protein n=1 Tax=Cyclotella cryptica TaxID=29204 RepID=A0ABD3PWT7_9STRA|eukprot:CCRYP_010716-RA/>CCRYP_010716-RA protein AED:0.36 eAED:0.61 QI:0/-1/0/1/-1/1/1/0/477
MIFQGYALALLSFVSFVRANAEGETRTIDANIGIPRNDGLAHSSKFFSTVHIEENSTNDGSTSEVTSHVNRKEEVETITSTERNESPCNHQFERLVNELSLANAKIAQLEEIKAEQDNELAHYKGVLQTTKAELADTISDLNDSFQANKYLEGKLERIKTDHVKELNETFHELESIAKESERHKRQLKTTEDRCHETRRLLSDRENELSEMRYIAGSQYVNFTLIGHDLVEFFHDILSMATRRVDRKLRRHSNRANPKIHHAKRKSKNRYHNTKQYMQSKATSVQRHFDRRWSQSKHVRPLFEQTWGKVARYTSNVYHPYEPIVNDIRESLHLSSLSAVEEVSKGVLGYLDDHVKRKEERETRRREREKERAERHRNKNRSHNRDRRRDINGKPAGEVKVEPTFLHKKLRKIFQFTLDNSDRLVKQCTSMLPLTLTLFLGNSCIIGGFLYFVVGVPYELILMFAIARLVRRIKRNSN